MSRIILNCIFLCLCGFLYASPHWTITLKNGSLITGDITGQRFGKDMTIEAENATFVIEPKDVVSKNSRKVKYDNLSREMKRWMLENRALKGDAYGRYAELEDIKTKKYSYNGLVKQTDKGNVTNTYIHVSPTTFVIKWGDIQSINKNNSDGVKYDLTDKVTTFAGKIYEGKILSQKIGKSITISTSKGQVTIPNNEIKEIRKLKQEGSDILLEHVDYKNLIVMKNGTEKEGLISMHHYGKKDKDNYIVLQKTNGKNENIPISDISEFRTKYDKKEASIYVPGKIYLNEFKIDKAKAQKISENVVFLDKQVYPFPEGISISFKSEGDKLSGKWSLLALSEVSTANGKTLWGYNVNNRKENTIPINSSDQQSAIRQLTYGYLSPGYYALVNDTDTEAYVFKITK